MDHEFSLPSLAKINWFLRILGKRGDGFHELCTLFQTVSLSDKLHFSSADTISLTCDDPDMPTGETNLIVRAAKSLLRAGGIREGARIHLEKRIPSPGGLGGGSSNAAVTLIGLSRLWKLEVPDTRLQAIAEDLGADVPFFLSGGTALGTGRGDTIEPADEIDEKIMLIVTPSADVLTRDAFETIAAPTLTKEALNRILRVCRLEARSLDLRQTVLINDFEQSVFSAHSEIRRVRETLLDLGAVTAALSGSGASVFAVFDKEETRQTAEKALDHESTWRKFAVATVSRSEYREMLHL